MGALGAVRCARLGFPRRQPRVSPGGTLTFVGPGLAHKSSSAVERQREYLLDMIPPRAIPQSATWK